MVMSGSWMEISPQLWMGGLNFALVILMAQSAMTGGTNSMLELFAGSLDTMQAVSFSQ